MLALVLGVSDTPLHGQGLLQPLRDALTTPLSAPAQSRDTSAEPARPGSLGLVGAELAGTEGVRVVSVDAGSAASSAGVKSDDVIVAINGKKVRTLDEMGMMLRGRSAGEMLELEIVRAGQAVRLSATLRAAGPPTIESLPAPPVPQTPSLGVTVLPVTADLQLRYGFRLAEGAVITNIASGSPAERYRLPIGGVIVDVDGQPIQAPADLEALVRAAQVGDELELAYFVREQRYRTKVRLAPAPAALAVDALRPAVPQDALPPAAGGGLENLLGQDGRRPLLGRLGRVLEGIVEPPATSPDAAAAPPAAQPAGPQPAASRTTAAQAESAEVQLLREEVQLLRREIELLRRRLEVLEQKR